MTRLKFLFVVFFVSLFASGSLKAQVLEGATPLDGVYERVWIEEKRPIPLAYVREADVLWSRRIWQVIDLRERINHPLYFPTTTIEDRQSLLDVFLASINEGSIRAFEDEEFTLPLTPAEMRNRTTRIDRRFLPDPDDPSIEVEVETEIPLNTQEVTKYRIKEEWFFDSKRSVLDVRILGIAPVRERFDPITGESRGDEVLFWIYFPEARNVLVNAQVFNRQNDAQRMSFDDLFLRRMFNSYIYKESNVYDRQINEYIEYTLDQLLEAESIKTNIRNYELDLWEY